MAELAHGLGQRRLRDAHRLALPERVLAVLHRRYPACSRVRRDGYSDGPTHHPYSDLRRFSISSEMYNTAACFWREVLRRGGFPAIRRILMRLRASPATTPAELVSKPTTSPVPARAGQRVTARVKVARSDTGDSPATVTVRCRARLGIRAANASVRSFANERATCSWRTPRSARGLSLSASVLVSYRGVSARRGVTVLLH